MSQPILLDNVLYFDNDTSLIQEQQELVDQVTEGMSKEQLEQLDTLLSFVRDRTEAHYDK